VLAAATLLATVAAFGSAAVAIALANRREARRRRGALAGCADLLDDPAPHLAPSGFGALRGFYRGRQASLTPIPETLAFRRLPQLWIAAAMRRDAGPLVSIDVIRRPNGGEFFTGGAALPMAFAPPASWPQDTSVRGDRNGARALLAIERPLAAAFQDPRLKAVTISPHGVRVVRQAVQGDRTAYLLFRDARFSDMGGLRGEAERALALADQLLDAMTAEVRHAA
jgi:hypothetical protein